MRLRALGTALALCVSASVPLLGASPAASASCAAGQAGTNAGTCVALPTGTSALTFDDEFPGTTIDPSLWNVLDVHGDRSGNDQACFLSGNSSESGGSLRELADAQSAVCPIDSNNGGTGTLSANYASGSVQSNYSFTYGTIQFRAKFAGGQGPWPAVWMLGTNCQSPNYLTVSPSACNWPDTGGQEVDLAEILNGDHANVNEQLHYGSDNSGCYPSTTDVSTTWHTYAVVWKPKRMVFKINGKVTCTLTSSVPYTPMFLIIDTAMGGNGGGSINDSTLPQTTQVDYVRVFQ